MRLDPSSRLYRILVIDDQLDQREQHYRATMGEACELEFVTMATHVRRHRDANYDAYLIDIVLDSGSWLTSASRVIDELQPQGREFPAPVFLVTNAWTKSERLPILGDEFARALDRRSPVRLILAWQAFEPPGANLEQRDLFREATRQSILLEISRWHGHANVALATDEPFRILHLNNFRFGTTTDENFAPMTASALARRLRQKRIGPHLIIVTGNMTRSASQIEFRLARSWLLELCEALWPGEPLSNRVLAVPGFDDINKVIACADDYEYSKERSGLVARSLTERSARTCDLAPLALAPFYRFSSDMLGGGRFIDVDGEAHVFVEHRFRRVGIRVIGVVPDVRRAENGAFITMPVDVLSALDLNASRGGAIDVIAIDRRESVHGLTMAQNIEPLDKDVLTVVLSGECEHQDGAANWAELGGSRVVLCGRPFDSLLRAFNIIEIACEAQSATVTSFKCETGRVIQLGSASAFGIDREAQRVSAREGDGGKEGGANMTDTSFSTNLNTQGRMRPWSLLRETDYLVKGPKFGPEQETAILDKLQELGFALLRMGSYTPEDALLGSLENSVGPACETQNDYEGKIKTIIPKAGVSANTGDSAAELGPHVDGTQDDPLPPAIVVFQYIEGPTHGGHSTFVDMADVLAGMTSAERRAVTSELAASDAATCIKKKLRKDGTTWVGRYEGPLVRTVGNETGLSFRLRFDVEDDAILKVKPQAQAAFDVIKQAVLRRGEEKRHTFIPQEGDIAIFDNWRVLHGRLAVSGKHVRHHNRVWIKRLAARHHGNVLLGVRGLSLELLHAVMQANRG